MSPQVFVPARRAVERKRLHRAYMFQNGYVMLVAALFVISSASFFWNPDRIDRTLPAHPWDFYWNGMYLVGGLMIIAGLTTRRVGIEAAGHALVVPGLALNFAALVGEVGLHTQTLIVAMFGVASLLCAYGLLMGWQEDNRDD